MQFTSNIHYVIVGYSGLSTKNITLKSLKIEKKLFSIFDMHIKCYKIINK